MAKEAQDLEKESISNKVVLLSAPNYNKVPSGDLHPPEKKNPSDK